MVKLVGLPVQVTPELVKAGVMVIVPVIGAFVRLVAVKEAMSPVPMAASPMAGFELTQL